jgi:hypothetical protein
VVWLSKFAAQIIVSGALFCVSGQGLPRRKRAIADALTINRFGDISMTAPLALSGGPTRSAEGEFRRKLHQQTSTAANDGFLESSGFQRRRP